MGTLEIFLCVFVGHFIAVQSAIYDQDATFPMDFPGFFQNPMPFPFERHFDFPTYDTIFSSWQPLTPDFHMLADLPPLMSIPRVGVFCDESTLTLRVYKKSNGVMLTGEQIQLGDGCYSNRELPNQFVFIYSLDECGTARVVQNGLEVFTNSLRFNFKTPPLNWWQTPSTVHISCIPRRSNYNPNFFVSTALHESGKTFNIKAMNSSWTSTAESNMYKRGQVVNLQVSATTKPEQQLFIQSCFVSASPEHQVKPKHAIIMNKGCTAPLGSPHAVVQFVASNRADVVNIVLNTTYLISELYVHCSVLVSDQGVTFASKSCNYNVTQSRWEDLSGTADVCECCSSKCKGPSAKHLPEDAKAIVSAGPFVIVDKDVERSPEASVPEPQETSSAPVADSMQSDAPEGAAAEDTIVSGDSISRSRFSSPPHGVVVVRQDPVARLTLWLPGLVQDAERGENIGCECDDSLTVELQESDAVSNDFPELQPSTTDQRSPLMMHTNKIGDLNLLTLVDGWALPPHLDKAAFAAESERKIRFGRSEMFGAEVPQEDDASFPVETTVNVLDLNDFNQMGDDPAVVSQDWARDVEPVIRSKLQFSKSTDGSQTLSYEEEVVKQQEGKGVDTRFGMHGIKRKQEPRKRGLLSTFVDLLRRMDKAE